MKARELRQRDNEGEKWVEDMLAFADGIEARVDRLEEMVMDMEQRLSELEDVATGDWDGRPVDPNPLGERL